MTGESPDGPVILRKRPAEDAEMDITPMIDITFLLLTFFLVCSSIDQVASVALPSAVHGSGISEDSATIITVESDGKEVTVYLGNGVSGDPLPQDTALQEKEIIDAVESGYRAGKTDVLLKAGGDAPHGEISRIHRLAGSVEGVNVHYAVIQKDE